MLYFGNPTHETVKGWMREGLIGCITRPDQGNRVPDGAMWIADNGRFTTKRDAYGTPLVGDLSPAWPGDEKYLRWLARPRPGYCRFVILPDQPFDMARTLELADEWIPRIRDAGYPVALALQNGAENMSIPWDRIDVACLGGDTDWKKGTVASALAREAREVHGKPVHMLRVNSLKRMRMAWGMGCDYCDGGFLRWPREDRLAEFRGWLDQISANGGQTMI